MQHNCAVPNQRTIFNRATFKVHDVADHTIVTHNSWKDMRGVQHRTILN